MRAIAILLYVALTMADERFRKGLLREDVLIRLRIAPEGDFTDLYVEGMTKAGATFAMQQDPRYIKAHVLA